MLLTREALERALARLNAPLHERERASLLSFDHPRFTLRFPEPVTLPADQCIDQRFTAIQFDLHRHDRVDTGIQGAEWREDERAYDVLYEVIIWD